MNSPARDQQAREIELELIRVRSAAEAARLEARAAELELLLRRMARGEAVDFPASNTAVSPQVGSSDRELRLHQNHVAHAQDSWSDRLARMRARSAALSSAAIKTPSVSDAVRLLDSRAADSLSNDALPETFAAPAERPAPATLPRDGDADEVAPQIHSTADVEEPTQTKSPAPVADLSHDDDKATSLPVELAASIPSPTVGHVAGSRGGPLGGAVALPADVAAKPKQWTTPLPGVASEGEEEESSRRFRPASWLVSTAAHVAILILLGFLTLASQPPKDQLAFTASPSESSEEEMETFTIETAQPTEESEPVPSETAYEISNVGTMAVTEVSLDLPPAPAAMTSSDLLSSASSSMSDSMMKSLKGDSSAKTQFCGVDGGGNHFIYLVDSSNSMRDGFQSARAELLASIDQLKPDQRFYVVFFDDEPDYMRIRDPNVDESASVMATPDNKQRLRRWAMTVQMNKGKAPYDVLPFALSLRPDVIFLLSDGEFPTRIEEILREQNREENLFGESGPISIVHTIRYHGIEGEVGRRAEATMVKIAKENGGQYRHVPKPR